MADEKGKVEQEEKVEEATAEEVDKTEKNDKTQQDEVNEQKMIPYWRFKEVVDEKNKLNDQLKDLQDKIEDMDDPEEIKKRLNEEKEQLENRNKEFLKKSEVKIKAIAEGIRKEALDDFLKAMSDKIEQLEVDGEEVKGVDELVADAKENKGFYFGEEKASSGKTAGDFNSSEETTSQDSNEDWAKKMADKFNF